MIRVEQSRQWTPTQYWQVFKVHCQYHYCHHRSVNHSQRHCSILLKALLGSGNRESYRCEAEGADRKTSGQSRPKSGGQTRTTKVNRKYINLTTTTGDELCFIQSFQFLSFSTVLMAFAAIFFIVSPRFIHQCIWKKRRKKCCTPMHQNDAMWRQEVVIVQHCRDSPTASSLRLEPN